MTSQGWIWVNLKLKEEYTVRMSMVIWIVSPNALTIDKYHQIEKINLWINLILYVLCVLKGFLKGFKLLFMVFCLMFMFACPLFDVRMCPYQLLKVIRLILCLSEDCLLEPTGTFLSIEPVKWLIPVYRG